MGAGGGEDLDGGTGVMGGALGKSLPGLPLRRANRLLPRVGSPITLLMKVISKALQKRVGDGAPGWLSQLSVHLWLMMTSAQVVISGFMSSSPSSPTSPASGSVLTAQSLEPPSDSLSPSLCPSSVCTLSQKQMNTKKKFFIKKSVTGKEVKVALRVLFCSALFTQYVRTI